MILEPLFLCLGAQIKRFPKAKEQLESLEGCAMQIVIDDWGVCMHVAVQNGALSCVPDRLDADVLLEGEGYAFLSFVRAKWVNDAITPKEGLRIEGNVHVANRFNQLFTSVPLDIESFLAQYLGDTGAHHARSFLQKTGQKMGMLANMALAQFADYQAYESGTWATGGEVERFCDEVDSLRFSIERLEQRVGNV